jgi:mannose-6-phosphate isomerase
MLPLYPLLLRPEFVERPWGAHDLSPVYPGHRCDKPVGEVWLTGDQNGVVNGPLAGRTLGELCREYGRALVGEAACQTDRFPLLIKFLFPREKLSVQVHPDDEAARRVGQPCGKSECWYVLAADTGAQVALGLKPGVTRQELARAIQDVRAEELLNWVDIYPGEMIYVDAGTVHTIGPGSILVETQQNSDTTYRLYDYGRPREIHIEQGLAVTKERTRAGKVERASNDDHLARLVASPSFVVHKHRGKSHVWDMETGESVQIVVAIEGGGALRVENDEPVNFSAGDAVVVPGSIARFQVKPELEIEFLTMCVPRGQVSEPVTVLPNFRIAAKEL